MKACPYCAEDIQDAAIVCRYCDRDLLPAPARIREAPAPVAPPTSPALEKKLDELKKEIDDLNNYVIDLEHRTDLLAPSYLSRAFTVWAYYLVANLLITVPILVTLFLLYLLRPTF